MCGIIGYTGGRSARGIIYGGLKKLEYRGYDSAGIATLDGRNISVVKRQGKVGELEGLLDALSGSTGIGHTRWATHGKPSDINAHPHLSGKFAVVHNGIIENFNELKDEYFKDDYFRSQTDSEIVAKLLDKFYGGNILDAVFKVANLLKGSYALLIICTDFDGLIAVKYKSPVILGYGEGENFVASDLPALSGVCREFSVMDDNDVAVVTKKEVKIYDGAKQYKRLKKMRNSALCEDTDLKGYPYYMIKEISENPATVKKTITSFFRVERKLKEEFEGVDRIIIIGCGTAYNSGLVAKRYIENFARICTEVETAGEFRYKNPVLTKGTAVIAVSQSGETADTVEASKAVKERGVKLIAVTNSPHSALSRIADAVVPVSAGAEICVAATKSYIGQVVALYLTAKLIAGDSGVKYLLPYIRLCEDTLALRGIDALADMCKCASGVYFLGRDIDYAVAVEASLKLKEITYIPSEGYPAGELKHGTLALIDESKVAVFIITDENLAVKSENAVDQVLSRRGKVAIITSLKDVETRWKNKAPVLKIPDCDGLLSPLLSATAVQRLAYVTAIKTGRNPDRPRNLAKSVTVE